ncbi:uncharacterized protein I206_105068 [Kwoniella pini CBS 10737]|uniref:Uncharacterized protein n=1 Tax=Kwoniella pini CBS 10737 TaxID=1296096 RepID=A0A1B9I8G9_9TREE|nr:uncharacterized protein I206_02608 [Kwoniella pini CBS 10737]OCF51892.1 hypothetical protein I206_02608 [Kwoniella pini CBS 10737]
MIGISGKWAKVFSRGLFRVQIINASFPILKPFGPRSSLLSENEDPGPSEKKQKTENKYDIEEIPILKGDFIGFSGGVGASRFAHGLKAGFQSCEFLVGGDRDGQVLANAANIWERGEDRNFTVVGAPKHGSCC